MGIDREKWKHDMVTQATSHFEQQRLLEFTKKLKASLMGAIKNGIDKKFCVFFGHQNMPRPIQLQYHTTTNLNSTKQDFQFAPRH